MRFFKWFTILLFLCCSPVFAKDHCNHKVKICHIPPGNPENAHTIEIDKSALQAHLAHGDFKGECVFDCMGIPHGKAMIDQCGVCGGDNSTCKDCAGVPNGSSVVDQCGVCDSDSSNDDLTCSGCDGVANSDKINDLCGVCGGDNSTCKDCAGVPNGSSVVDQCGVCGGDNSTCKDCAGVPNGTSRIDSCGHCSSEEFPSTSCLDCAGVPNGTAISDSCGVCGGSNSCAGCDGVPNSGKTVDSCGICGGDGTSCHYNCPMTHINIDVSKLLASAKRLHSNTVKYSKRSVQCDSSMKKSANKRISKSVNVLSEFIQEINSLKLDVNLCPGTCIEAVNRSAISKLKHLSNILYKYSSDAQHSARKGCGNKDAPVANTKKELDILTGNINNCPTKICN